MASSHVDVVAVGPITQDMPFILSAVVPSGSKIFGGGNDQIDTYVYSPLIGVFNTAGTTLLSIAAVPATYGSMLQNSTPPVWIGDGKTLITRMLYWRTFRIPMSGSSPANYDYQAFAGQTVFFAYTSPTTSNPNDFIVKDPASNIPYSLTFVKDYGTGNQSSRIVLALALPSSANTPFNLTTNTSHPNNIADFPNLQAGMRYSITNMTSNMFMFIPPSFTGAAQLIQPPSAFAGLPWQIDTNDIHDDGVGGRSQILANGIDFVLQPTNWLVNAADCTTRQAITSTSFDAGKFHLCDRWGALSGVSSPFYVNSCNNVNNQRGNTSAYYCQLTSNDLYYPSALGTTCGQAWPSGVSYVDLTEKTVVATTTMGACDVGYCTLETGGTGYVCLQSNDSTGTGGACGPSSDPTFCNTNCLTEYCTSSCGWCKAPTSPDCSEKTCGNDPTWKATVDCTKCAGSPDLRKGISPLGWIILGILIVVILILLFIHMRQRSKKAEIDPKPEKPLIPSGDDLEEV